MLGGYYDKKYYSKQCHTYDILVCIAFVNDRLIRLVKKYNKNLYNYFIFKKLKDFAIYIIKIGRRKTQNNKNAKHRK